MPEPIIRVEKLSKSFGELEVLKDINMEVREGEVISGIGSFRFWKKYFPALHQPSGNTQFLENLLYGRCGK